MLLVLFIMIYGGIMDTIMLCSGYLPSTTFIHNIFIENYMLSANGSYVKVYIYLAKCIQAGEKNLSVSSLADKMDNTEKDILRALNYWEKNNLINLLKNGPGNEITGIEMLNPDSPSPAKAVKHPVKSAKNEELAALKADTTSAKEKTSAGSGSTAKNIVQKPDIPLSTPEIQNPPVEDLDTKTASLLSTANKKQVEINITPDQTRRLSDDEEFVWTCRVIESYINKPLNPKEVQLISYLYDNLGFSPDLLLYLYEYCISLGKTNVNYIQAVAFSWDEQDIKNPEDAKNASSNYNSTHTAISKALALGRPLAMVEKQYISRWMDEWHMDLSVVLDACSRTMLKLQKADFKYTDGILDNWHKKNIHTLQDVGKEDEIYAQKKAGIQNKKTAVTTPVKQQDKNQFNKFLQREISQAEIDELEKKLLAH
jgi:DnaD/phage-associated family protein